MTEIIFSFLVSHAFYILYGIVYGIVGLMILGISMAIIEKIYSFIQKHKNHG